MNYSNNLGIKGLDRNGQTIYLIVENFKISFNIKLNKTLLGYFKSEYIRGYIDLQEDAFFVSNKNEVKDLPEKPLENWNEIDIDKTPLNIKGSFIEAINYQRLEKISFNNFVINEV